MSVKPALEKKLPAGRPKRLDAEGAIDLVSRREVGPAREIFHRHEEALTAELEAHFWGFPQASLKTHAQSYGIFFSRIDYPVPILWLGFAWSLRDPKQTLPSLGASIQITEPHLAAIEHDRGGLRSSLEAAVQLAPDRVRYGSYPRHVELAEFQRLDALLDAPDQPAVIVSFWRSYLELLAAAGVPEAVDAFIDLD